MTLHDALLEASLLVPRREAESLLAHTLGCERTWLLAHPEQALDADRLAALRRLIERRAAHEPLQYLTGTQEFFGLRLRVTPATLIPRPETEHLVEAVLAWVRERPQPADGWRIADIGTGSGAIALALAAHLPSALILATDISAAALEVARANADALHLPGIEFRRQDLLGEAAPLSIDGSDGGDGSFDVIVSNPPYVPAADAPALPSEVRDFEPHTALFAGTDGLDVYRRLLPQAWQHLRPAGLLAMELGFGQRDALAALLAGWHSVRFLEDYAGISRVVLAERPQDL